MNLAGLWGLFRKEVLRFLKVGVQTVLAPVITALLFLLIFGHVLGGVVIYEEFAYTLFLVPGLVMMSVTQNAFANSSSSLVQSKMMGNVVFMLLAPLSTLEIYLAFVAAAVLRGLLVGVGVLAAAALMVPISIYNPLLVLLFVLLSSAVMGGLGLIAAIWADRFDHLATFQNFIVIPLTFLSGTFYSLQSLPPFWQAASVFNPIFYMIDGFRYSFLGVSDVSVWVSLGVISLFFAATSLFSMLLLNSGYKLRG